MVNKTQQAFFTILKGELPSTLDQVNKDELFELFQRHRLFTLAPSFKELLTKEEWLRWKQALHSRILKSLQYTSQLALILKQFTKEGIAAMPMKGPVLNHTLYQGANQRYFRDLDLYVSRKDLPSAIRIMKDQGYELLSPAKEFSEKQWRYYYRYKYDLALIHRTQGIVVELHTGLYYPDLFEASNEYLLWEEPEIIQLGESNVSIMNKENTFLYLTMHGGHHLYFRLFWLRDVAEALRVWDLDHSRVISTAKALNVERLFLVSLLLVNTLFSIDLPEIYSVEISKEEKQLNKLKKSCMHAILGSETPGFRLKLEKFFFFLKLRSDLFYKWAVVKNLAHRWYIRKFMS